MKRRITPITNTVQPLCQADLLAVRGGQSTTTVKPATTRPTGTKFVGDDLGDP